MPQRRADAVGSRVAAADDDDVLVLGVDVTAVFEIAREQALRVGGQELHREVNAGELAARDLEIARLRRARRQQQRVVLGAQLLRIDVLADVGVRDELDAGRAQQVDAAVDDALVELHVRNAVHQQAADAIGALVDGDLVTGFVELVGGREAGRTRADDGNALAAARRGHVRLDPTFGEAAVDDRVLDVLDRDGGIRDAEHAGALARRRARAARELREVVGLVQPVERVAPAALVDQVVPFRNQVVDRAAVVGLAKRHAAVHAARALVTQMVLGRLR